MPLPASLLNPLIYSDVLSKRLGLVWRPRPNLEVESRLSRNQYLFTFLNEVANRYRQFDTTVLYKFGRFTIMLGYSRANGEALNFNQQVNRFFLRVRFPFHVLLREPQLLHDDPGGNHGVGPGIGQTSTKRVKLCSAVR